jgi:omega-amidase
LGYQGKFKIFKNHNAYIFNFTLILILNKMQDLTIALIQTSLFWEEPAKNREHFARLLGKITEPVDLILLPEMFNTGFTINTATCGESMGGPSVIFLKEKAREKNTPVMATLIIGEGGDFFNRLVCAFPDGHLETYDKRHLFRLVEEYKILKGGKKRTLINIKGWNIMPIICYDLRFPVWSKNTFKNGKYEYDLLVCLANWPNTRAHIWKTLLPARAIDNQAYSVGVNRVGDDGNGIFHSGDSRVCDAKGQVLAAAEAGKEEIVTVTLSAQELRNFRESFTVGLDWDSFALA